MQTVVNGLATTISEKMTTEFSRKTRAVVLPKTWPRLDIMVDIHSTAIPIPNLDRLRNFSECSRV